jgi:oligopeptide transport system ATP-binding protein
MSEETSKRPELSQAQKKKVSDKERKAAYLKELSEAKKQLADCEAKHKEAQEQLKANKISQEDFKKEEEAFAKQKHDLDYQIAVIKSGLSTIGVTYRQDLVDQHVIMSVEHLKQFFSMGGDYKTKAVHDVSFQVHEGECFGLVGESGCGKTTTGRCLIRLYDITSGSIYYKGYRISGGTRWHEKEIKWSKIHTKEKIAALEEKQSEAIHSIPLKSRDLEALLGNLQKEKADELKEKSDPQDEDNDSVVESINATYDPRIKETESLIEAARSNESEQKAKIISIYQNEIKALKENEKEHVKEQKESIHQIKYDNHHVNDLKVADPNGGQHTLMSEIQMIFQDPVDSLDPRMTVEDIIQEGLHIQHHYNSAENHEKCVEILRKVGLIAEYASRYPHEFSGGQRQRIGIARALIMNPRFLICDEPISALDVSIRAQILNLLNDIKVEMGLTMLFIAHDLSVVKYFCDRIAVMYFGNMVELATSEELFRHPLHPYTQALLSAIPKPDPLSEKNRIRKVYNPAKTHDYSKQKPTFREILPGHWILCNDAEEAGYRQQITKMDTDRAALVRATPLKTAVPPSAEKKSGKKK